MADNVLGTLFGDIANAIRAKTGDTATMKPIDFPTKISEIEVSSSGGSGGSVIVNEGTIKPTADKQIYTIEHGLGVVPDLIIVRIYHAISETQMPNYYYTIYGGFSFSSAFLERIPSDLRSEFGAWWVWVGGDVGFMTVTGGGLDLTNSEIWGHIRNGNASTFQVGGSKSAHMPEGAEYKWCAVAGLL